MDEARQRFEWQQAATIACVIYNTACDTRKTGPLTPGMVHPMADDGSEQAGQRKTPGVSLTKDTAKALRAGWHGKVITYNPKDF